MRRDLGVGYGTLRRLPERKTDEECLGSIGGEKGIFLGIDEHSFKHREMMHSVTKVKKKGTLGILREP